jgi:hypothetical protein
MSMKQTEWIVINRGNSNAIIKLGICSECQFQNLSIQNKCSNIDECICKKSNNSLPTKKICICFQHFFLADNK